MADQVTLRTVREVDLEMLERFLTDEETASTFQWEGWRDPRLIFLLLLEHRHRPAPRDPRSGFRDDGTARPGHLPFQPHPGEPHRSRHRPRQPRRTARPSEGGLHPRGC